MGTRLVFPKSISKRRHRALAGILAGLALLWLLAIPDSSLQLRESGLALVAFVARLNAALAAYFVSLDCDTRERFAWRLLTVALGLWCIADFLAFFGWMDADPSRIQPRLRDLPLLAGYVAFLTGLTTFPATRMERFGYVRNILEVVLVTLSAVGVAWFSIVRPVLRVGPPGMVAVVWSVVYLVLDISALALSLRMATVTGRGPMRQVFLGLGAGSLLLMVGDAADFYRVLIGGMSASGLREASSSWGAGLMTLALLVAPAGSQRDQAPPGRQSDWLSRAAILVPVVGVYLILGLTIVDWWASGIVDWVGVALTAMLALLLVARQGIITGQSEMRQYATLVEGAADMAFVCDSTGKLLLSNPALEQAVGLESAPNASANLADFLVEPADADHLLQRARSKGWSGEAKLLARSGDVFPAALSLRPILDERRGQEVLTATAHDLTERMAREERLQEALQEVAAAREELEALNRSLEAKVRSRTQELAETVNHLERLNQELKELDRLKSEFVTLVSHELRGPLSNIRTGVELALKRSQAVPDSIEDTLERVAAETERLVSFVEIILDLSALEAGRFPMTSETVSLEAAATTVIGRIPPEAGGNRIEVQLPPELPPALADERSLMSVLFHLLDNAMKYAPAGPIIITGGVEEGLVQLAVEDAGQGIPEAERESVFEGFHRLDASDSREVYGHGLGLHLSQRLLRAMGGRIEVQQSEAGGARVVFWLPAADGRAPD